MSSLIFFYFYDLVYYADRKKKQKATGQNDPKQTQGSNTPGSAATRTEALIPQRPAEQKNPLMKAQWQFQKTATGSGAGSSSSRLGNSTFGSDGSSSSSTSTTAYLERKAKEDARDHAQGKARGTGASPIRKPADVWSACGIMRWDSIPKGNRVVKCNYCGGRESDFGAL